MSAVDPTVPIFGNPTTASVRNNFVTIKSELEALQGAPPVTSLPMAGDVTGTTGGSTVAKVNGVAVSGTPTSGQVLTATGAGAASWQAATGGMNALTGDVTGSGTGSVATTVGRLNGTVTISATGATTVGNVLKVTSSNVASWTPENSNVTMGGDVTGLSNASVVSKVNGISVSGTPAAGNVLTANSISTAIWAAPAVTVPTYNTGSAAGTNQGNATPITGALSVDFLNITGGTGGVRWDFTTPSAGQTVRINVRNSTASTIEFYPKSGAQINNLTTNTGIGGIPPNTTGVFWAVSSTQIFSVP